MKFKVLLLFATILLLSCEQNEKINSNSNNLLTGSWTNPIYKGNQITFTRALSLPNDNYGIQFKGNGSYIEKSFGWCATPPLSFVNFEGNYELNKKSNVIMIYGSHTKDIVWKIKEISASTLIVEITYTDQELDHRILLDLFSEIETLAYSYTCEDEGEWFFTPYGSKPCGGPMGFIPYSNQIDIPQFLEKVNKYTNAENVFNVKWGVVSTCEITTEPKGVVCQNQVPYLIY